MILLITYANNLYSYLLDFSHYYYTCKKSKKAKGIIFWHTSSTQNWESIDYKSDKEKALSAKMVGQNTKYDGAGAAASKVNTGNGANLSFALVKVSL